MTTLRHTATLGGQSSAPYRAGEQVFAVYTTTRGTEANYGRVLACVPTHAKHDERSGQSDEHREAWTVIAEIGDLLLTYPLDPAGHHPRLHRPIRRHPLDRVLPTLLHAAPPPTTADEHGPSGRGVGHVGDSATRWPSSWPRQSLPRARAPASARKPGAGLNRDKDGPTALTEILRSPVELIAPPRA